MHAIETHALTKRYKSVTAVDALDLAVEQGELFALLGVNGAGKSTTLKMLSCLTPPTEGDALMLGRSVRREPRAVKQFISVSPQETAVAPNLTVQENLEFFYGIYGHTAAQAKRAAREAVDRFDFSSVAGRKARTLSGGWQRRLSIALALISQPKILFLDEPTLGLDVLARRELWEVIRALKGQITVILTTHYLEEAESLADRIGVMARGKLAAVGTAAELKARTGGATLEDAFVALCGKGGMAQ